MSSAPQTGWVKLHRSILEWQWIGDPNVVVVFLQILLRVNRVPKRWQGIDIPAGSFVTSRDTIAQSCGLSEKQVRRALEVLKGAETIDTQRAGLGQLVSLRNWEEYQYDAPAQGRTTASRRAEAGPRQGRGRAGTEEGRESGEGKKSRSAPNGAQAGGQLPIDGMPPPPPPVTPRGPNPSVQAVVEYLEAKVIEKGIAPALDPPEGKNRQYAHLLITKLAKDYPEYDPVDVAKRLVDFALNDPRQAPRCTKVAFLFYNAGSLAAEAKAKKSNPRTQSDGDRKLELAERLADFAQRSAGDV